MEALTKSVKSKVMKLNQYEWDPENDVIGYGAFAEVFRAKDNTGHYAALKIYREAITKGSTGGVVQSKYTLEEEYKKGELLSHTNVIRYINLDYIVHVDSMQRSVSYPVLIMEYADAGSLSDWLKSTTSPTEAEALCVAREILNGLVYLHEQRIIHRDLKPGNILFKKDRMGSKVAKISDFGISRDTLQDNTNRPSATAGVGTIDYMAPEQLLKKTYGLNGEVSNRTDLWAVGVILYRMLTGKMPFGEENKDYENIHSEIISKEPDYSKVPAKYQAVIKACLQKYASARPADANAVLKMLEDAYKRQPEESTTIDEKRRIQINPDPITDDHKQWQQQQKGKDFVIPSPKPKPIGKYIAIIAGAILVIVLGIKFLHSGGQQVTNLSLTDSRNISYNYTGTLRNNVPDGTGTATYLNRDVYTGEWQNGEPVNGTINYANGSKYVGPEKNFYPDGQGTFTFQSGDQYVGDFAHGLRTGNATEYFNADNEYKGDKYIGSFVNGQFSGQGVYYWHNGNIYDGKWISGQRSGAGVSTVDGVKYQEVWLNGTKLSSTKM